MKSLAILALSALATAVMATTPTPDPQITINGASTQAVYLTGAMVSNKAEENTEAHQNLASNSGNVLINGHSTQTVGAGPFAVIRNTAEGDGAYAVQDLASNVGNVTVNGSSMQMVSVIAGSVTNEADGRNSKAVQNLASNNACFTCQKAATPPSDGHGDH
jgi:hypothetical protein